jgi:hypothetical protein
VRNDPGLKARHAAHAEHAVMKPRLETQADVACLMFFLVSDSFITIYE